MCSKLFQVFALILLRTLDCKSAPGPLLVELKLKPNLLSAFLFFEFVLY